MLKKVFITVCVCIYSLSCLTAFADAIDSEAIDFENAVLVSNGERPDIYNIDLSEDLDGNSFEELHIKDSINLMAAKANNMEFQSVTNTLKTANNILSGEVTATFTTSETADGALYLGIYEENRLTAVYAKSFNQEAGTYNLTFSDISIALSSDAYTFKLFMTDKNLRPLGETYVFESSASAKGVIFADGADVSPNAPTYYQNGNISADINVFSGLGAVLQYDSDNNVIWIRKNNVKVGMYINDNVLYVFKGNNRYTVTCDNGSFIQNSCIYVPVTEICTVFGFEAVYNHSTKQTFLYSNEVLKAAYSIKFDADTNAGRYSSGIPTSDYYSAHINNGLTYFTAMGSHYIYVSNGSQMIKYDVGSGNYPAYVLSEGDYIYYTVGSTLMKLDKNTSKKTELTTSMGLLSSSTTGLSYYNGELYFDGSGQIYNLQTGKTTYSSLTPAIDRDVSIIPLSRNTLCDIRANYTSNKTSVTVKIVDKITKKTLSEQKFSFDTTSSYTNRYFRAKYIGDSLYLKLYHVVSGIEKSVKITLADSYKISSVSEITNTDVNAAWLMEEHTQSNFSITRAANTYRFWQDDTLIKAENRMTGEIITVKDLSYRCNKLLFADDTYYIYCVYGITRSKRDGKYVYQYNGESALYLVYYSGESVKLYST